MNKKERMYAKIEKHGQDLNKLFSLREDPIKLCKKLFRLEQKAHKISLDYCNGIIDSDKADYLSNDILNKVADILGDDETVGVRVFHNYDARGYALKIEFEDTDKRRYEIYRDWGGYGIIAPDFNE